MTIRGINNTNLNPNGLIELKFNEAFDKVEKVANVIEDVIALANISDDIEFLTTTENLNSINNVANSIDNIEIVNSNLTGLNTVAQNINNINLVKNNLTAINNVSSHLPLTEGNSVLDVSIPGLDFPMTMSIKDMLHRSHYYAEEFGFVNDNVTDNTPAWNRMVTFFNTLTGGFTEPNNFTPVSQDNKYAYKVLFNKGKYRFFQNDTTNLADLTFSLSAVTLEGAGHKFTEFLCNSIKVGDSRLVLNNADQSIKRHVAWDSLITKIRITAVAVSKPCVDMDCPSKFRLYEVDINCAAWHPTVVPEIIGLRINNSQWDSLEYVSIFGVTKTGVWIDSDTNTDNAVGDTVAKQENFFASQGILKKVSVVMGSPVPNQIVSAILIKDRLLNNTSVFRVAESFYDCKFQIYTRSDLRNNQSTTVGLAIDNNIDVGVQDSTLSFTNCFFENFQHILFPGSTFAGIITWKDCAFYGNGNGIYMFGECANRITNLFYGYIKCVGSGQVFNGTNTLVANYGKFEVASNNTPFNGIIDFTALSFNNPEGFLRLGTLGSSGTLTIPAVTGITDKAFYTTEPFIDNLFTDAGLTGDLPTLTTEVRNTLATLLEAIATNIGIVVDNTTIVNEINNTTLAQEFVLTTYNSLPRLMAGTTTIVPRNVTQFKKALGILLRSPIGVFNRHSMFPNPSSNQFSFGLYLINGASFPGKSINSLRIPLANTGTNPTIILGNNIFSITNKMKITVRNLQLNNVVTESVESICNLNFRCRFNDNSNYKSSGYSNTIYANGIRQTGLTTSGIVIGSAAGIPSTDILDGSITISLIDSANGVVYVAEGELISQTSNNIYKVFSEFGEFTPVGITSVDLLLTNNTSAFANNANSFLTFERIND